MQQIESSCTIPSPTCFSSFPPASPPFQRRATTTTSQPDQAPLALPSPLDPRRRPPPPGLARAHEYFVRRAAVLARHQLSEAEEQLAAALLPSGLSGWARLQRDMGALHTVALTLEGEEQSLPISAVRALAHDPDREIRRTA